MLAHDTLFQNFMPIDQNAFSDLYIYFCGMFAFEDLDKVFSSLEIRRLMFPLTLEEILLFAVHKCKHLGSGYKDFLRKFSKRTIFSG